MTSADAKNKSVLRKLFTNWPGMVLTVEHGVFIVGGNGMQRRHSGGDHMNIHRPFNLIDVACDFCVEYCGSGSLENFLRGHKYSLRCIMIFAVLFKAFCMEFMAQVEYLKTNAVSTPPSENGTYPDPADIQVQGLCLKDLIPGPSTQKSLLESSCLRMIRSEFNLHNHVLTDTEADSHLNDDGRALEMIEIEESEEIGIGALYTICSAARSVTLMSRPDYRASFHNHYLSALNVVA